MSEVWRRLQYLLSRRRQEQDLADEMRLHRDLVGQASGLSSSLRSFGNVAQLQEASRAVWIWPFLETLAQDTRYALRTLSANPGFAATAVLSLALGIGANTAIFSILNAVMLRSLPVEDPPRLVQARLSGERRPFHQPNLGAGARSPEGFLRNSGPRNGPLRSV
ncbi:MAG: hypothetical protein ABSG65_05565 [Bryobacteraceae bacterium]|jgi:hypothetical protein